MGFWKRICQGTAGDKKLHPETPENFDPSLCPALMIKGNQLSDPCVRAEAQYTALMFNIKYGFLSKCCEVEDLDGNLITAAQALQMVKNLIESGECKKAADLAESINSGEALPD